MKKHKWHVDKYLQIALNTALVLLALILCGLLVKEIFHLINLAFFQEGERAHTELLEGILVFFLYFEFIAMIVKYFQEDYHFPLRYFMYIGITAMVRLIVVVHEDPEQTLLFSGSILILVISYFLINYMHARIKR
ncbi:MAG: phosphate-starvation-inducible protein PsiE [Thermoanaerobacteraceae bacterium]|nr:phosphate-starvation-inducible protein PsiE [Thermoanaerobacteraceae bacterium]